MNLYASIGQSKKKDLDFILTNFKSDLSTKEVLNLKKKIFKMSGKAIPGLVTVMKSKKYPDKNRWVATMTLARIMGKKSSAFLAKFLNHPNWVLRMASMKSLLALGEKKYANEYAKALKDKSFIVRRQALDVIIKLNLKSKAAHVWAMLYDKDNYYRPKKGAAKRTNLIKEAVRSVGYLKFQKAKVPLFTMVQKPKYEDIFKEMDYSLTMITGKKSPKGDQATKRRFWKKISLMSKTF
jgi:hypothetical protein